MSKVQIYFIYKTIFIFLTSAVVRSHLKSDCQHVAVMLLLAHINKLTNGKCWSETRVWPDSLETNPICVSLLSSLQTYSHRISVGSIKNWTWRPVSVRVGTGITTAAPTDTSTATPVSASATLRLLPPALRTTSSIGTPVSAHVARRVLGTSPSTKQSVPANVTSHLTSVSLREGGSTKPHAGKEGWGWGGVLDHDCNQIVLFSWEVPQLSEMTWKYLKWPP